MTRHDSTTYELIKASPTVSVGTLTLWGVSLSDWVMVLTLVWTVILILDKLPSLYRHYLAIKERLNK